MLQRNFKLQSSLPFRPLYRITGQALSRNLVFFQLF